MTGSTASKWTIRNIYLYLVCLITLIIFLFSVSDLVSNLYSVAFPPPAYQPPYSEKLAPDGRALTVEEQEKFQAYQAKYERSNQRYQAQKGSIRDAVMLIFVIPMYLYHWRKIQDERE